MSARAGTVEDGRGHSAMHFSDAPSSAAQASKWLRWAFRDPAMSIGPIMLGALWVSIFYHVWTCTAADMNAAIQNNSNLARAFSQHVSLTVRDIDSTLLLARKLMTTKGPHVQLSDISSTLAWNEDYVVQLAATDRDGFLSETSLGSVDGTMNLNDRAHISYHRQTHEDLLYVSEPVLGRVSNKWSIQFTRRILPDDPAGSGVLIASVTPEYFSSFYRAFDLGRGSISLINANGIVLARGSKDGHSTTSKVHLAAAAIVKPENDVKCFMQPTGRPLMQKLHCARAVPGADLYVVVSTPEEDIGADNLKQFFTFLIGALFTLVCLGLMRASYVRRKRLKLALEDAENARHAAGNSARELRYTLENMCHGIMLIDGDGRIPVFNDNAFALLGLPTPGPREEVTNDDLRRLLAKSAVNTAYPELRSLAAAARLDCEEIMHCAGSGGRVVKVWTQRIGDRYVRKIEDVTQPFLAEKTRASARDKEQAASKARAAFVTRISHEIRTPLHAAMGFSRLLTREIMPAPARTIAMEMHASTSHLIEIIDEVLDFSLVEAGQMRLALGVIDIRSVVDTVARTGKVLLGRKPVAFTARVEPCAPEALRGDERRLRQILTNLVSNAVKFTERGEILLRVSCLPGGAGLLIHVIDTGCGIPAEDLNTIFEPFMRAHAADDKPGAGLGLTIVKEIVTAMHGRITVTSTPGGGTSFQVSVPLQPTDVKAPGAQTRQHVRPAPHPRRRRHPLKPDAHRDDARGQGTFRRDRDQRPRSRRGERRGGLRPHSPRHPDAGHGRPRGGGGHRQQRHADRPPAAAVCAHRAGPAGRPDRHAQGRHRGRSQKTVRGK